MNKEGSWSSISRTKKILLIIIAALCAAGCGLYLCFNSYEAAQKLDDTFDFGDFTFTGAYDLLFGKTGEEEDDTVRVAVQYDPGVKITSQNPVDVQPGQKVTFTFEPIEGYSIDSVTGAQVEGNTLTVDSVYTPLTVYFTTHALKMCNLTAKTADFGDAYGETPGTVTLSADTSWSEHEVTATAVPDDCFEFVCYTSGAPASEGGTVLSESAEYTFCPDSDLELYANFKRTYALINFVETDGLRVMSIPTVKAAIGKSAFFIISLEDGVAAEGVTEGAVLSGRQVTVSDVKKPMTLSVTTRRLAKYSVSLRSSDPEGGTVKLDTENSYAWEGSTLTATADTNAHWQFLGYSLDKTLDEGGKIIASDFQYTFNINADTVLYANFKLITYTVTIPEYEGLHITSDSTVNVIAGGSAQFTYTLDNGYLLDDLPEGVSASGGVITVTNVLEDRTLEVHAILNNFKQFRLYVDDNSFGSVSSDRTNGKYKPGTQITLSVTSTSGIFRGWSVGRSYANGGTIVSTAKTYTFTLQYDVNVYANFEDPAKTVTVPTNKQVVLYFPNGGKYNGSLTNGYHMETSASDFYWCPNALPNVNYFTREGYVLLGYNTKADGTGTYYAPGWNIEMPERGAISLFCQWEKVTDTSKFTYTVSGSSVTITGYNGNDEFVVIPETIDGKSVTEIAVGTIVSKGTLKKLYLSKNIKTIAATAVVNCQNFTTLYICDSVTSMPNNWMSSCPNMQKMIISAIRWHANPTACYGTYTIKYDWLHAAPGNRIVIVSGSNSAYGINSPELMSKLKEAGYTYNVVNFGQNASCAACFFIEACSALMHEGDILIHEPEFHSKYQFGENTIDNNIWTIFEGSFEAFANVDIRHYKSVYSTFATFNSKRSTNQKAYDLHSTQINRYGDLSYLKQQVDTDSNWTKFKPTVDKYDAAGGVGSYTYSSGTNFINSANISELNRVYDICAEKGVNVLFSFPAILKTCLTANSQTSGGSEQTGYINAIDTKLHCTRISVPADYQFGREYIYNSVNHINSAGAIVRSDNLAKDLIAYFKSVKK